jgi:hypothetical protein
MAQLLEMPLSGDQNHNARVERLAAVGAREEEIAADLQIPVKRLRKRFRVELERGNARGKHAVLENLYDTALACTQLSATALWVKARCGWRDTGSSAQSATQINSSLKIITTAPSCPKEIPN